MTSTSGTSVEDETLVILKIFNDLGQLMDHSEPTLRHLVILDPVIYLVLEPYERYVILDVIFLFYNLLYSLLDLRYDRVLPIKGVVNWEKAQRILALHVSGPHGC